MKVENRFSSGFIACLGMLIIICFATDLSGRDYHVTGTVTDKSGRAVSDARISMLAGSAEYAAVSSTDGSYSLRISGIYELVPDLLLQGIPYPNPFMNSINIPFIINSSGDIRVMIHNISGQKIREFFFPAVGAGSYQLIWDGRTGNGASAKQGMYIYTILFSGKSWSGRLVKYSSGSSLSAVSVLEQIQIPSAAPSLPGSYRIPVITMVTCRDYYPVKLTDITIGCDTTINFEICTSSDIPFTTTDNFVAMHTGSAYRPLNLKGINLGSSPPGTFPGEIAYAITEKVYEDWISRIARAGFNSIRVYTLHPPEFYEKLANHNYRNPDNPLLLFQGIWLEEIEDGSVSSDYDLLLRTNAFRNEIREVIDCLHGEKEIAFRLGRAYGSYRTDLSQWTAAYVIGREIMPQEVDTTNKFHPSVTSFSGNQLSISGATASEVFVTQMLDETVTYEYQ
ncbi:MAG: T9SS type A sorting domain-containing protein, partial [Bacteroidales bacterium]|nr:T9SS type A sorting domain-containing protein [Bacteroidales bacterium]